jgi:hypothetical protein
MMDSRRMFMVLTLAFVAITALIGWSYYTHKGEVKNAIQQGAQTQDEGMMCAQVITTARNPETGETQDFPDSCIPKGWESIGPAQSSY